MPKTKVYAFDFDGVMCDSAIETGIAGWKVASRLWPDMPAETPAEMIEKFRQVRPVMETGYEAVIIMRKLFEGVEPSVLLKNINVQIKAIIRRDVLNIEGLKKRFGTTRDAWIAENLDEWIGMNPLFDGIKDKISQIDPQNAYIITTKQERFVSQILKANNISFPDDHIYGLDRNLSKQQVLADLEMSHPEQAIVFVEDRYPTLLNVIEDERLNELQLFFADWGYNTEQDKLDAKEHARIRAISLAEITSL